MIENYEESIEDIKSENLIQENNEDESSALGRRTDILEGAAIADDLTDYDVYDEKEPDSDV
jgi:hypothetical protein